MSKEDNKLNYIPNKITIQSEDRWPEIKEWRDFQKQKQEIKDKYPSKPWITTHTDGRGNYKNPFEQQWWDDWCAYKKEITDLMLAVDGNFSRFLFEIRPERQELYTKIWLKGKYNTKKYNRNKHKNK